MIINYDYLHFEPYLSGQQSFLWHHYFELHYWKGFLKRVLKKLLRGRTAAVRAFLN